MNKLTYVFFIALVVIIPLNIFGQNKQQLTDEQRKEQLKKKLAELNQQELLELERQVELKDREVKALQNTNTVLENKIYKTDKEKPAASFVQPSLLITPETAITRNGPQDINSRNSSETSTNQEVPETITGNTNATSLNALAERKKSVVPQQNWNPKCATTRNTTLDKKICEWAADAVREFNLGNTLELDVLPDVIAPVFVSRLVQTGKISLDAVVRDFLIKAEDSRVDKQVGADSKSSGTTSLAVKGGVPAFLNWAVENGAATSTTTGTSTTFRINPVGFFETITGQAPVTIEPSYKPNSFLGNLKRTSLGLTFDLSRGSDPNVFTGDKQQLSAISFRYEFVNQRNNYKKKLKEFFDSDVAEIYAGAQIGASEVLILKGDKTGRKLKDADAQKWFEELNDALAAKSAAAGFSTKTKDQQLAEVEAEIKAALPNFPVDGVVVNKPFLAALTEYTLNAQAYVAKTTKLLKAAREGQVFTFEYTNNREIAAPDTSNFRLIYEVNTFFNSDFTLNGSLTFYHKKPTGMDVKKIKDFNFSGQLDVPLTGIESLRRGQLIFAFKYQRLMGDAVALDGTVVPNTKGDIAVGQIKLMIPIYKGIRLPISATFANRTELVKEKEVRGNFGFTFDIDTILTMLRGQ